MRSKKTSVNERRNCNDGVSGAPVANCRRYANVSIFDVSGAEELHDILSTLPLFPFMEITVSPLCRHPSSIRDNDT